MLFAFKWALLCLSTLCYQKRQLKKLKTQLCIIFSCLIFTADVNNERMQEGIKKQVLIVLSQFQISNSFMSGTRNLDYSDLNYSDLDYNNLD